MFFENTKTSNRISLFYGYDNAGKPRQYARVTLPDGRPTFNSWFKKYLFFMQDGACFYCASPIVYISESHVDHVNPVKHGGGHSVDNLVLACPRCNMCKGSSSIEVFRLNLAISQSPIAGVINATQAAKLMDLGVHLPVDFDHVFWFEKG